MSPNNKKRIVETDSDFSSYSDIRYLKGIKRKAGVGYVSERLIFENGEIVIESKYGILKAYSVKYVTEKEPEVTHECPIQIIRKSISPEKALSNAKSGIIERLRYYERIRKMKELRKIETPEKFNPYGLEGITITRIAS